MTIFALGDIVIVLAVLADIHLAVLADGRAGRWPCWPMAVLADGRAGRWPCWPMAVLADGRAGRAGHLTVLAT